MAENMIEQLGMLAANRADDVALITVDAQGDTRYTYGEVARRAAALAAGLRARAGGSAAGARVLLMMDSGIDYVAAFFGCLYAGAIAVPAYAPESPREQHLARLRALADDADAAFIVTSAVLRDRLGAAFAAIAPRAECLAIGATGAVDAIGGEAGGVDAPIAPEARVAHPAAPADIAFLQYTSGSTSAPKGVMVTHGGLWANESAIREGLGVSAADVFVSWLPLYHDMGLIGTLSQPIFSGIPLVLMSPQYFLERPVRWLEAISRHRGTISGGPDFSYRLCAERLGDAQCAGLDLSSWRVAFSGAEPVRKATLDLFAARFAGAGFDARALFPCYGLAEATLYVSGAGTGVRAPAFDPRALEASRAHADDHGVALVSCGRPPSGHAIAIVDAASGAALENGHIGEILVRGPSLAAGYWRQPEATERTFVRRDGATWLRTGDLGFLHEGDVYIAGRIKDLLIVHGRNLYPQDLERTIEREVACVRPGRVAAFAVEVDGREGIGIAAELSRATRQRTTPEAAAASLTAAVALACGEPAGVVVLLNPGGLPKTSSGKVQRAACARGWSARSLDASAYFIKGHRMDAPAGEAAADAPDAPPLSPMERALADVWRETLPCLNARSPLAASDSFFAHGGDSLTAVQLAAAVRARWPVDYTVRDVFAAPALGEAAARIDTMRARAPVPAAPTLVRLPDAQRRVSRASASQRGLWLLWHRDPSSTAYNMNGELRIDGPLDAAALQRAFDAVIRRHDVLRARFAQDEEGEALQIVDAGMTVPLALTRLDAFSVPLQNAALTEITERTAHAPFDLERGPPMRAHLVVLGANAHRLLLSLHHIVADGWSVNLLLDGLAQSYRTQLAASGRADGTRGATPGAFSAAGDARPLQYADFVAWHSAAFDADAQARQLAYWRAQLADDGDPAAAAVLFDAPGRGAAGDPAGRQRCHAFCLPPAVAAALKGCAAPRRATPFMAMLAVFAVVLQRLSGKDDIRIGAPISLRKHAEAQSMVGYFIALHVLRTRMASHDDFAGLLAGVRDTVLAAQDHSDIAFDRLVSALLPRRALGSEALFQVKLTEQRPFAEQGFAPLAARLHVLPNEAAHFDLALDFTDTGERIDCVLAYDDGVFDAAFAERLASMFIALAQQLAAAPERALVDHAGRTLDGEAEPARNAPADRALPGPGADVLTRWRAHLAGAATRVALHDDGRCITFGELDAATDALARRLGASGVCAETRVGVLAERSIEHVLGMLAVLKAGGTWLPLDPHAPVARNAAQLADSGAAVLLHAGVLPAGIDGIVTLPLAWHPAGTAPHSASDTAPDGGARAPCVAVHPDQAAYMIYTSGSTGAPKGVVVSHRALADYVAGMLDTLDVGADASFAMVSTPAADLGHTVLFGALCSGRTLHLLAAECVFNPDRFADYMAAHRVDVLKIVPGHLAALLSAARARDVLPREALILGGESTSAELLDAVRALAAPCRIFNHYGPTETTVGVAMYALPADAGAGRALPLGTALPHVRLRVLDARMAPVAPGGEGELHVGGTSVARGYWGKPGLTAERFVPDAEVPGARCYRTGDRGRVDDTGLLEYLGRTDDQVKIRGYRVEPGEIAGVLRRLDGVRDAAVLAHDTPAGKRLTAFVAGGSGRDAVLAYAARCLPDHMVPADVIVLDTLPLNANGKLDRAALRGLLARASAASAANAAVRAAAADATTIGGTAADTAVVGVTALDPAVGDPAVGDATAGDARTVDATAGDATAGGDTAWVGATEPVLARIWAEAIGVPPEAIRRDHNFFEVGGDSILGLKVVAKARKAGLSITPKQLFQRLTLAALAAQVASRPAASGGAPAMPSVPSAVAARADAAERAAIIRLPEAARMRTPASHAQQRQWFLWQLAPQSSAYHIAGGLWLTGTVDAPALRASLEAIVARHEVLRTRFVANEAGQVEQWIDAAARLDWREARLAPAQIEPVTRAWADTPFDLERGPLLRAALHHETSAAGAGGRCLLALALHHIVADGWSIQVLLEELVAHYRAALAGGAPCVAALPVQYADYAAWQRDWLEAGEQARQLAYWRATLGETHPVLALPTDAPRQARASYRAARHRVRLPAGLSQALRARAQASSATPFMVLLAAFQALLHRYTGQDDIRVGVPVANRHRVETEPLIGFFVNTQVLRARVTGHDTLGTLLERAREATLGAQAHQDLPFDALVDALRPERSLDHTPLFQVMFNHQRSDWRALDGLPGLRVERYRLPQPLAQFELMLDTREETDGTLSVEVTYARELFHDATIARFVRHYQRCLSAYAHGGLNRPLHDVVLLDDAETDMIAGWSRHPAGGVDSADSEPVFRHFERHAARHPEDIALVCGAAVMRYGELNARANQLAHWLGTQGIGVESRVGVAAERSFELVIALCAIVKAGAAYVPLDPAYPADRLAYMIADSRPALVLRQSGLSLPEIDGTPCVALDAIATDAFAAGDPAPPLHGANLAYVIYTSGSTGRPKGVGNHHAALRNRLAWMQHAYNLRRGEAVLQKTPFGFDVSVWEFFWPLMVGARLVLAEPGAHRDPSRLAAIIREQQVGTVHFVPSMLEAFMDSGAGAACAGTLARVICSGEALSADLQRRVFRDLPGVALYNLYGPTEAAIDVTAWTCVDEPGRPVPIGRPIARTQTWVLDAQLSPVPPGVPGELYLGGAGLARGYLRQPALTAERFVPDPFSRDGGARLYRTGDLVRWREDGALDYLGRLDHQVKIRGLRIEPGEIEAVLRQEPGVREAVVTTSGERLVAYVTGAVPEPAALRARLAGTLPDYMVPWRIVVLDTLPLGENGKLDRRALPEPASDVAGDADGEAPRPGVETQLATIWSALLGVAQIGRHDDFFDLGGHSLLAVRLNARIGLELGVGLPLAALFEATTLAGHAAAIERARADQPGDAVLQGLDLFMDTL